MSKHTIHLGVTGLRRTGKTVFLTSLIYQLRERGRRGLAAFDARAIELLPAEFGSTTGLGKFPYEAYLADLRKEPPTWPDPTDTEYQATLLIPFRENNARGSLRFVPRKLRNRLRTRSGTIELHIHDYPGEFLLDVELSRLSFQEWSHRTSQRMREQCPEQAGQYDRVVREIGTVAGSDSEDRLSRLRAAYADYVAAAHANHFEMIQPGMALLPWTRNLASNRGSNDPGRNILPFVPIPPDANGLEELRQSLRDAYMRYVENDVARFVRDLGTSSTQVVLVDVLRILSNGLPCYNDTSRCLESTLTAYQYPGNWFKPRRHAARDLGNKAIGWAYQCPNNWFKRRIRRVVFVAAKADHALNAHRPNMARLLETLVEKGADGSAVAYHPDTDGWRRCGRRPMPLIEGTAGRKRC